MGCPRITLLPKAFPRKIVSIGLSLLAIGATPPPPAAKPASAPSSTLHGAYSDPQAQAGAQLYAVRCAMCHGKQLEGTYETPGLQHLFIANWSRAPIANLYDYIARAMPQFAPGSLKPEETAQIVAYLLRSNGLPAGKQPLPTQSSALRQIMLEPKSLAAPPARTALPRAVPTT
jgi:mono/diheme cytochrome c family protein